MGFGLMAGIDLWAAGITPRFERGLWLAAAACIQLRLLANMLDGMVAIQTRRASPLGELYNEVPDRVSDSAALIGLGFAPHSSPLLGLAAALAAVLTAYIRAVGKVAGAQQEFCGPMAKQHRMFVLTLFAVFCGVAPVGWRHIGTVPLAQIVLGVIMVGSFGTALRRLSRIRAALKREKA